MFRLRFDTGFWECYERITKNNMLLRKRIKKTLALIAHNPRHPSLRTHKGLTKRWGMRYSSWVIGDLRIIWDYEDDGVFLLGLGGHSGKRNVYR